MKQDNLTDEEIVTRFIEENPGLTLLPRCYPEGKIVMAKWACDGRLVFESYTPETARVMAAVQRLLADQLDSAAGQAEKLIEHGCEGSA